MGNGFSAAGYHYLANSPLVSQIQFTNGSALRMTTTKQYDNLNRLTSIQSSAGVSPAASSAYSYNNANQRMSMTNADNWYWVYQYETLVQVISGAKYGRWHAGGGSAFTYNFDDIGNRKATYEGSVLEL